MAVQGSYFGLPLTTLRALQDQFVACIGQITTVGKSYTIGNRSYTLLDLNEINQSLLEVNAALLKATGRRKKSVLAVMTYRSPANPGGPYQ